MQILYIANLTSIPYLNMEMVKYQTTDDIWGFTFAGKRAETDYDTSYVLHNNIQLIPRINPFG